MANILIIEDQPTLIDNLIFFLESARHNLVIDKRDKENDVIKCINEEQIDLVLLDLSLPSNGEDPEPEVGFNLLQTISCAKPTLPVIILSSGFTADNQNKAVQLGANDFIGKKELSERLLLEKIGKLLPAKTLSVICGGKLFTLHHGARTVTIDHKKLDLTAAQYDILRHLLKNPNAVISKKDLCRAYSKTSNNLLREYENDFDIKRSVDEKVDRHIANLRIEIAKVARVKDTSTFIETSYGRGFKLNGVFE